MKIILASSSLYRKQLLNKLHLNALCISPDIDESFAPDEGIQTIVSRLAYAKASAIFNQTHGKRLIIGSDQLCERDGEILGKPLTKEAAISQLKNASGKKVTFYTSLCVINEAGAKIEHITTTSVYFRELSQEEIENYISIESPLDCAGAFKCEGLGIALFKRIESHDPTALIGLSLIDVANALKTFGINPLLTK